MTTAPFEPSSDDLSLQPDAPAEAAEPSQPIEPTDSEGTES